MSSAGAPPPPTPPRRSLQDLPAELLLAIIQYLRTEDYATMALAIYPKLQRHGLVPPLTPSTIRRIVRIDPQTTPPLPGDTSTTVMGMDTHLPIELVEEILRYLEPTDVIAAIFAHPRLILRYVPTPVSRDTKRRLWNLIEEG